MNGVPSPLCDLYSRFSTELHWELDPAQFGSNLNGVYGLTSGSVDIYAKFESLEQHGYLPSGTTIEQIEYGFEVAGAGGVQETFHITGWTITASHP